MLMAELHDAIPVVIKPPASSRIPSSDGCKETGLRRSAVHSYINCHGRRAAAHDYAMTDVCMGAERSTCVQYQAEPAAWHNRYPAASTGRACIKVPKRRRRTIFFLFPGYQY
jgi:hypothetical protein